MVVGEANIHNIMGGMESNTGVRLHNHKRKLKQRFDIIKKLGQGTYGKVQLGINKETGQEVAIKTIKKCKIETDADLIRIRREIQIMSSVQHPNIIHIYEVFENKEKMVLVMEYAAGGELYDYLSERKVLPEEEARRIFRQISTAVYYCHKHKICHRDLKLENILLDQIGNAKIADFGLSNVFDEQRLLNTFCGSPLYASPEIVKGTPYHGPEVDCWSLGVLLYTLVYGAMPFDGSNFKRLVKQISQSDYFEPKIPSPASLLIKEMLTVCPSRRADIEKICTHWWVNEGYEQNCLEIAEELAAQTPVRLDLLLSLVSQPANAEKLVVGSQQPSLSQPSSSISQKINSISSKVPVRCHSIGSLMQFDRGSNEQVDKKNMITCIDSQRKCKTSNTDEKSDESQRQESTKKKIRNDNLTTTKDRSHVTHHTAPISNLTVGGLMKIDSNEVSDSINSLIDSKNQELTTFSSEIKESNILSNEKNFHNDEDDTIIKQKNSQGLLSLQDENSKINITSKQKIKTNETPISLKNMNPIKYECNKICKQQKNNKSNDVTNQSTKNIKKLKNKALSLDFEPSTIEVPSKISERRKSKIFETAEKFNQLLSPVEPEKSKKIIIPGVNVGGTKLAFERRANLSSTILSQTTKVPVSKITSSDIVSFNEKESKSNKNEEERKRAVDIISGALGKPPLQKKHEGVIFSNDPTRLDIVKASSSTNDLCNTTDSSIDAIDIKNNHEEMNLHIKDIIPVPNSSSLNESNKKEDNKRNEMEITLKSATLPRPRKTTKAEITLSNTCSTAKDFCSEATAKVNMSKSHKLVGQRSEVIIPVTTILQQANRGSSLEPETFLRSQTSKEHVIPIRIESLSHPLCMHTLTPSKAILSQRSLSQHSDSLSRQSTVESDIENTFNSNFSSESMHKSQKEYIIPIAIEGGGYLMSRSNSTEPKTLNKTSTNSTKIRHNKPRKVGSMLLDTNEDESAFSLIQRDNDDVFQRHMHRLRSSRPSRQVSEYADSISSGEDDDDDGFELLTAENLFSTLLSRVRSLTQRLNVDDSRISSFSSNGLLGRRNFNSTQEFWKVHEPLSRYT